MSSLAQSDPEVAAIIREEESRQQQKLSLIPSENFFSSSVREAVGSVFMHKYAEGNIGRRYYEGNQYVDELEALTIARARRAFALPSDWDVNVQALSGSNANLAVYLALLNFGDTILSMYLPDGGHLSHGWSFEPDAAKRTQDAGADQLVYRGGSRKVNIVSRMFRVVQYKTDPVTRVFNYDVLAQVAAEHKPQLIITGGTAYPRDIDYARVRQIADSVGALYLADIAHEAGLIAAGVLPSPVGIADAVTLTTHKTLRAGRGAIILAPTGAIKKINRAIMPGLQGGPHNHNIAGICVGLGEVLQPVFAAYARQIVANAQALAAALSAQRFTLVAGGTDKHLLLLDLTHEPLLGKKFARALDAAGLVANANSMPQETRSPVDPSALRVGTPWVTTRGMREGEMQQIAAWLREVMTIASSWAADDFAVFNARAAASRELAAIAGQVRELCVAFPLVLREKPSILAVLRR
ncbi:MAG TPA: serine hydroxymethyltransferase [Candidatus Andersenbacteria bacterium]|nr:serine hydroxymethyltransferase [Candidatus Andersenbacteria bacterium]